MFSFLSVSRAWLPAHWNGLLKLKEYKKPPFQKNSVANRFTGKYLTPTVCKISCKDADLNYFEFFKQRATCLTKIKRVWVLKVFCLIFQALEATFLNS